MSIMRFGTTKNGAPVEAIRLKKGNKTATILTYGGTLQAFTVDGRDIICGFDSMEQYEDNEPHLGGLIGRYANRLEDGKFVLNDVEYPVVKNENDITHIHGGTVGFDRRIWGYKVFGNEKGEGVHLRLTAKDGEEGYPGNVSVKVTYFLNDEGLAIHYHAVSDRDTLLNMTNHAYFNVDGYASESVLSHKLEICADTYTAVNKDLIPIDAAVPVAGTSFDFREPKPVSACTGEELDQFTFTGGLDHNFNIFSAETISRFHKNLTRAARVEGEIGALTLYTDFPCVQVYTANFLDGPEPLKDGLAQKKGRAICLEAQNCGANGPVRGEGILRAGEEYDYIAYFCPETL